MSGNRRQSCRPLRIIHVAVQRSASHRTVPLVEAEGREGREGTAEVEVAGHFHCACEGTTLQSTRP